MTVSGFRTRTIGELCEQGGGSVQTGPFGSQLHQSDYSEEGVPVVMPANISSGCIEQSGIARVSEQHVDRLARHQLEVGDIIYGRRGDIGRQALVKSESSGWLCGTGCLRIRLGDCEVDPRYLHRYLSMSEIIGWIQGQAIGATMPNLNTDILSRVPITYPSLRDQRKIAAVLTAYDDLIENNRQRIALLERMAEEIYREWFVRLRFPGHEHTPIHKGVPEGWSTGKLAEIADMIFGQSPPSEYYNEDGDGLPFHQGVGTYGDRYPSHTTFCSVDGRKARSGSILFSVRAPVGRLNIADREVILGRGLAGLNEKNGRNGYLYQLLTQHFSREDLIGNGAIFASVSKRELENFPVFRPDDEFVDRFQKMVEPMDKQIDELHQANSLLSKTRDVLLNRLISGKLRVDDLDITFPPSMESAEQPAALTEESPECAIRKLRGKVRWEGDLEAMRKTE